MVSQDRIAWTRDTLERIYDLGFLQRSLDTASSVGNSAGALSGKELQSLLLRHIEQLRPSNDVATSSSAWRIYNALEYRYVRGLTQAEAATELNVSLRQLRREQDRGIEAVATLLFNSKHQASETPDTKVTRPELQPHSIQHNEYMRLDDLLHSVLSLIDPLLMRKNVDVQVTLPHQTPVLWANRVLLRQLLIMAVSYAIQGTVDGNLTIGSEVIDNRVELVLQRKGMPVATTDVLADNRATLQRLAEESNIALTISSGEKASTSLRLSIPISARQCVLMIDDSADAIELDRRYLQRTQFDLLAVSRADDALIQAQTIQPDCILLDVMIPGHDGWEILALLKSHPSTINIPVIVCSVLQNQELAFALGAKAILPRPHTAAQLIDVLQSVTELPVQSQAARSS
jgi:CheY-like chemotaxis protein